jgi:hypothetical protein
MKTLRLFLLLAVVLLVPASLAAQTFGGPFPPIAIPDNPGGACSPVFLTAVQTVTVPGGLGTISNVTISVGLTHTWYGDLDFTIDHGGVTVQLMGPVLPCTGFGDSSDLTGLYTFDDAATVTFDAAAAMVVANVVIPPGSYIGDSPLAAFLGQDPAGVWTFTVWDQAAGDTGTFFDARVSLGLCNTNYTIGQPGGPGGNLEIAHTCGFPGNTFLSAIAVGPGGVPSGWFYGLNVSINVLLVEISFGIPFFGVLDAAGNAIFSFPGIPPGLVLSSVGLHFDSSTGFATFISPAFAYTVQ